MAKNNEIIDKTIDASGMGVPIEGFFDKEKRYGLTPLDHKVLTESDSKLMEWSKRFLLISIGLGLTSLSKLIWFLYQFKKADDVQKQELKIDIENWELIYLAIGLGLSLILFLLSLTKLGNSDRKKLMKKIKKYFDGE
nr:hypothetical protein [uncultured Allomuricauda sp.]